MIKNELIYSNNFASNSDLIYSQTVTEDYFYENYKNNKNIEVISKTSNELFSAITFKIKKFTLEENQIIYCNTDFVENLFIQIKNIKFKNLKLITNQSDRPVTKKLFLKKPSCISKWYSINVDFSDKDLIPIPLGLSNDISSKNLNSEKFKSIDYSFFSENKLNKLYINFNPNTNLKERGWIYEHFKSKEYVYIEQTNLDLEKYKKQLSKYRFVLCPWGNGYDSHRIWETLYSGSIPVIRNHTTFRYMKHLPVIVLDDFENITFERLEKEYRVLQEKEYNYEILKLPWWFKDLSKTIDSTKKLEESKYKPLIQNILVIKYKCNQNFKSQLKKVLYYLRRLKKLGKYVRKQY